MPYDDEDRRAAWRRYAATPKGKAATRKASENTYQGRKKKLADLKMASGCVDCGYRKYAGALEFDHVPGRGEKLFSLAGNHCRSWALILDEIAKCDIVCANCHRERTHQRKIEAEEGYGTKGYSDAAPAPVVPLVPVP